MTEPHDLEIERIYLHQAWDSASSAIKGAFALNAGASVAILAFIGSLIQGSKRHINGDHIAAVMATFCGGLILAVIVQVLAYLAIYSYHQSYGQARLRLRTHSQKSTVAARAMAERKTVGHRS